MSTDRVRSLRRGAITLLVVATAYEAAARRGRFAPALMPPLGAVARTLVDSILDGTMIEHAGATLYRVLVGFGLAVGVGLPLGVLMGRFRPVENFFLPLTSALMPIPSLAWVPVFILWFGLGNTVTILIVFYAALFPMLLNTWSGAEMLAASDWGFGWVIFDAKEFLDTDMMLASLVVIGCIGFFTERLVFGSIERAPIYRWGMARAAKV